METSIDLDTEEYAEDHDDIEQENDQNEELEEGNENNEQLDGNENNEQLDGNENNEQLDGNENKEEDDANQKKTVKPKRVIKRPRPKLNFETLKSSKGLMCLEGYFKNKQFKGRGHEEEDLRTIMKSYEYWCHRLFPKFSFDDCISKIETLGTKKNVQVYLKRIRMDSVFEEEQPLESDKEEETVNEVVPQQFDNLLSQNNIVNESLLTEEQIERMRRNKEMANRRRQEKLQKQREKIEEHVNQENNTGEEYSVNECSNLQSETLGTKKNVQVYVKQIGIDSVIDEEQPLESDKEDETVNEAVPQQYDNLLSQSNIVNESPLTEEQLERMRRNKEMANRRRQEKLQKQREKIEEHISQESNTGEEYSVNECRTLQSETSTITIENELREYAADNL